MSLGFFRRTRRASSALVAAVFTAAGVMVCVPVPVAAQTGHCASVAMSGEAEHPCTQPAAAIDCCVDGSQGPAVPTAPQDVARVDGPSAASTPHGAVVAHTPGRASASVLRTAPVHGHRHIDLPTLNAVFLI